MNVALPDFFRLVDFYNGDDIKKVKYFMFFITVVANLRDDMTPRILAHRMSDQKINLDEQQIVHILKTNARFFEVSPHDDRRDRLPEETAYVLTDSEKKSLIRFTNGKWARVNRMNSPGFKIFVLFLFLVLILTMAFAGWQFSLCHSDDMSWTEFQERVHMASLPKEEKAKYFLFFITRQMNIINDIMPNVISERLRYSGLGDIEPKEIEEYFLSHPSAVAPSPLRAGAYIITDNEYLRIRESIYHSKDNPIRFWWMVGQLTAQDIGVLAPVFIAILGCAFALGRYLGNPIGNNVDLLTSKCMRVP